MPNRSNWPSGPTPAQATAQVAAVLADVPRFVTAPLYRRWHLRWGATPAECSAPMPGDRLLPGAQYRCTRAITVRAQPTEVWPWLIQAGCLRAGFYSDDLLDNLAHPSAERIMPEWQDLRVGQRVPMSPTPSPDTAFVVAAFETGRWLLWSKPDSTWSWVLTADGDGGTRLVTRVRARYLWRRPVSAGVSVLLMEFGDFAMMRRMLLGIRRRAEDAVANTRPGRARGTDPARGPAPRDPAAGSR
jgi:hypothetical protein